MVPPRALALKSPAGSHPTGYTTRCGQPSRSPLEGSGGRKRLLRVWRERCGQGLEGGGAEPRPRTGGACSESPGERELPPLPGSGETQWEHVTTPEHLANGAGRGGGGGVRGSGVPGARAAKQAQKQFRRGPCIRKTVSVITLITFFPMTDTTVLRSPTRCAQKAREERRERLPAAARRRGGHGRRRVPPSRAVFLSRRFQEQRPLRASAPCEVPPPAPRAVQWECSHRAGVVRPPVGARVQTPPAPGAGWEAVRTTL